MKIIIAGPVTTKKSSGGVAVFNENIAKSLANLDKNNQILIATKNINSIENIEGYPNNISIVDITNFKVLKKFNPDIIISSLWYSLFFCLGYSRSIKVHILHGFTNYRDYSDWKFQIMHTMDKKIRKNFNFLIANSEFTKYINENIFGLKIDGVFSIGLPQNQIHKLTSSNCTDNKNILYVGRLVSAKRVDKIIEAVEKLEDSEYDKFKIVGYGAEKSNLQHLSMKDKKIEFIGSVPPEKTPNIYKNARVFVSLNPSEPFGITYEEAIAAGLFVVAPNTGGQVEFLKKFPERCLFVDINDTNSIVNAIKIGLNKKLKSLTKDEIESLNYKTTLKQIFKVIQNAS